MPDAFLGGADLCVRAAQVGEQAPAAAGASRGVRLRHRHILIERPHRPINRAATIGTMTLTDTTFEDYLDATRDERLESYKAFLRIPSISALPAHRDDCRATATWLAGALERAGAEHAALEETTGNPAVYADWLHAGPEAPTVLIYGHYDVQPVDPLDLWTSPPFEPVIVGDRMLARGSADDKGQIHLHVMALAALLATRGTLPVNVRCLFEGDEEDDAPRGVPRQWLTANRERLTADVAVISDTGFFDGNLPSITMACVAARAWRCGRSRVRRSTSTPGHSGGAVQNPANALVQILAALKGLGRGGSASRVSMSRRTSR